MYYNNRVLDFADGMLNLESTADGTKTALPADIIVLSTGVKPNDQLFNDLRAAGHPSVWKVGDANHTDKIYIVRITVKKSIEDFCHFRHFSSMNHS